MKTILFPTDFSANANQALIHAAHIADKCKAKLILYNAFWLPVYEFDTADEIEHKEHRFRKESLRELAISEKKIKANYPDIITSILCTNGYVADATINIAKDHAVDLIVMGTKGATGLKEIIMGSNAVDVITKTTCPVLVIPEQAHNPTYNKLVFASNFSENEMEDISFLIQLGKLFDSEITIAHVTEDDFIIETADKVILQKIKKDVKQSTHYEKITHKLLKGDVIEELNEFINDNGTDLLAMVTFKKSFLSKIFNKSLTQKMAFNIQIPLLVIPGLN